MTSYKVVFQKKALKFVEKNKKDGLKFYQAFVDISEDKNNIFKYDVKKLKIKDTFRLRIGKYRAIFEIDDDKIIILVFDIASRGDIYKSLEKIR
ncbi:MAG: hypothetical protein CSA86_00185 [Arcobacter sp.]|nr:MAG: hypothetical protein CSA86_00185 [Arcobacter sp.]